MTALLTHLTQLAQLMGEYDHPGMEVELLSLAHTAAAEGDEKSKWNYTARYWRLRALAAETRLRARR